DGIKRRVRVHMIVTRGVDEMDQISSQGIRTRPTLHAILQALRDEPLSSMLPNFLSRSKRSAPLSRTPWTAPKASLADDFHQHALFPPAVELAVENLFPGPEVQPAVGDRHDDFASHDLPLDVS